jgi:hypothetical protein
VKKVVENLPQLRHKLAAINDNYQNIQQDILETFIDRGQLRQLGGRGSGFTLVSFYS